MITQYYNDVTSRDARKYTFFNVLNKLKAFILMDKHNFFNVFKQLCHIVLHVLSSELHTFFNVINKLRAIFYVLWIYGFILIYTVTPLYTLIKLSLSPIKHKTIMDNYLNNIVILV